jgi:hypothetical protein
MTGGTWTVGASVWINVSASDSIGISNGGNNPINVTTSNGQVEVVCKVAGAKAIDYPAKLECCTDCANPYNLTWLASGAMSCALSLPPILLAPAMARWLNGESSC